MLEGRTLKCQSGIVDRDAVEPADLAVGVALRDLVHLRVLVGDLGVDLARDEVAGAELGHQVRQRATLAWRRSSSISSAGIVPESAQ